MRAPKKPLRQRDAIALGRRLAEAQRAIEDLNLAWGVWADDVRQDAERRLGTDADETLWADQDYSRALDGGGPIRQAAEAVRGAGTWFSKIEAAELAEPEAEL